MCLPLKSFIYKVMFHCHVWLPEVESTGAGRNFQDRVDDTMVDIDRILRKEQWIILASVN